MKPLVIYKWLWLLSERDMSARLVEFSPSKNLLAGSNGTGKSRVVKHLHWALGAEPQKRAAGEFDSNVVAALRVQVGAREYTLIRQNRKRAAFNAIGDLIFATQSASEWNKFFAHTFDFELQLQRPEEGEFGYAGPSYAALPFYIDQDGGWGTKWTSFWDLGQFLGWQQPLFQSFTGLKPARFVRARLARDQVAFRLKEAKVGLRLQDDSFRRVAAMLPERAATLDESVFAQELRVASEQAQLLTQQQEEARTILLDLAQEREQKHAELQLALRSERDLVEDLAYLAGHKDSETLECPTCGQQHGITFRARLTLADDARDMHELGVKLQRDVETLSGKEVALRKTLSAVATKMSELTASLGVEHGGVPLSDVVAARSKDTLTRVYDESRRDLAAGVDELETNKRALDEELAGLTEKSREKRVRGLYKASLISFADKLDVHKSELGSKATIGVRPPQASGSYLPRAVLAMHLALLECHRDSGDGPIFPFVVDTPQQSGQDPVSLARMLVAILEGSPGGQTLVASESIPEGWRVPDDCKVIEFQVKRGLLRESEFAEGIKTLAPFVVAMSEALKEVPAGPPEEAAVANEDDDDTEDDVL